MAESSLGLSAILISFMKIIAVPYDDPVKGFPKTYARDNIPKIGRYPDGQTVPNPKNLDFKPGQLLGCVSGELGLRKFLYCPRSTAYLN